MELEVYSESPQEKAVTERLRRDGCLVKTYYTHGTSPGRCARLDNVGELLKLAMNVDRERSSSGGHTTLEVHS